MNDCLWMTGSETDRDFEFSACDRANVYVTGLTGEYGAAGFCGNDGRSTWRSNEFAAHAYTVCWRYL
ncbi:hypothetical protein BJF83_21885 [Nocardiopsis sp. CNR-923]|uniref:hypothetical protein n=1 Tax=Nocardiopsis sp. CNR-923 TaxID=1904965 RepID=UPI000961E84C|nr:hypothetical protein [Nocardiopsis sp. CNR-923]OLT25991.1 hypothetical protein BJF83_21885 [Nocardiopsis sp. CNR-923]